ncbi:hypothetical protein Tco_0335150 [Tanacetum coccineum]
MPYLCDRRGMWDRRVSIGQTSNANSVAEGGIDNLTMEKYLELTRGKQASGVEDTFSGNKNYDAYEHVERVLDIVILFNIPGVSHDAVMLRDFPITLTRATKRWVDRLPLGTVDSWDLLKKSFIQRGAPLEKDCPLNKEAKSVEEVICGEFGEASKRHVEQDEWLKKFYQSTQINQEAHDKIIQGLETKVKPLANEVEGRVNNGKFKECKTISNRSVTLKASQKAIGGRRKRISDRFVTEKVSLKSVVWIETLKQQIIRKVYLVPYARGLTEIEGFRGTESSDQQNALI